MLEIISNGILLDLPEDIQINLTIENALMFSERIPVPYTLSYELPPTDTNLKAYGYPNRATSFKISETKTQLIFDGVTFSYGITVLQSFEGNLKMNYKGVSIFSDLTQKLYDVPMERYEFGVAQQVKNGKGKWGINRNDPNNFAYKYRAFCNSSITNKKFAMAPVRIGTDYLTIIDKEVTIKPPLGAEVKIPLKLCLPTNSADEMFFNFYNQRDLDFNITSNFNITKLPDYYSSPIYNTRAFPFPYLGYVFDVCFKETLVENPFNNGELANLVIVCPFHPKYKKINGFFEDDDFEGMLFDNPDNQSGAFVPFLQLNSFMPDMATNEFLREVMKLFCLSLYPVGDKFKMVRNSDIISNSSVEEWPQNILIGKPKLTIEPKLSYKFGYDDIDDQVVNIPDQNKVYSIKDLINLSVPESSNFNADYLVTSTNEYYNKEMLSPPDGLYTRLNSGYGKSEETSLEEFDTVSKISPLPMGINGYWIEKSPVPQNIPNLANWYVPEYSGDRFTRPTNVNIMFYRGMTPGLVPNRQYPLLTANNYDQFGNRLGNYSLAWKGDDGLINKFHREFKDWIEKDKLAMTQTVLFDAMRLKMLDLTKKKHINGRNFFIKQIQVTITKKNIQPAVVDFLEA